MYRAAALRISFWQVLTLSTGVLLGTSTLVSAAAPAGRDAWPAVLAAAGAAVLLTYVWHGLLVACATPVESDPGTDRSQRKSRHWEGCLWVATVGPVLGRTVSTLYCIYYIHLAALVLRNMVSLLGVEILPRTPTPVLLAVLMGLATWSASQGVEATARLAEAVAPPALLASIGILIFALVTPGLLDPSQLRPVLEHGYRPLLHGGLAALAFPFGDMIALLPLTASRQRPDRVAAAMRWAMLGVGLVLAGRQARNVAILGMPEVVRFVFPGLAVAKLVELGRVVQRMETLAVFVWINAGFIKLVVMLLASASSVRESLNLNEDKQMPPIVAAISLLAGVLAAGLYGTDMEMVRFATNTWPIYALIFELVIPGMVLIAVRLRKPYGRVRPRLG